MLSAADSAGVAGTAAAVASSAAGELVAAAVAVAVPHLLQPGSQTAEWTGGLKQGSRGVAVRDWQFENQTELV